MRKIVAAAVGLGLLAAACGGSSEPVATTPRERSPLTTTLAPQDMTTTSTRAPAAPVGFYAYNGDGFSMFMPEDWEIAARGDVELQAILRELADSGLGDVIPGIEAAFSQGGRLFAFDFAESTLEFTNNINVLRLDPPGVSAQSLVSLAEKDIGRLGGKNVEGRSEWLPAGEAVIVTYTLPADLGGGEGLSYTVLTNDSQWVVTYTALEVEPFRASFEMMMDSFRER